jgi:hypothetical protein
VIPRYPGHSFPLALLREKGLAGLIKDLFSFIDHPLLAAATNKLSTVLRKRRLETLSSATPGSPERN